jgi:predicted anti-sigma-YlaC factor YlaD
MNAVPWSLARSVYMVAIIVLTTVVLWPWLQGPAVICMSLFAGMAGSGIIDDRVSRRESTWKTALAQGIVGGVAVWLTLRWLER